MRLRKRLVRARIRGTGSQMFTFLIPLVGRTPRVSWERVSELLGGTLRSVLAQTDPEFRVLVAGHDRPDVRELDDSRVTFLRVDFPLPSAVGTERADHHGKIRFLIGESLRRGADAIAIMDADDRVSRRLVAHFRASPHPTGHLFTQGYAWDYATGCFATVDDAFRRPFHQRCGSCSILALDEPRKRFGDDIAGLETWLSGFVHHVEIAGYASEQGRPLAKLPFPGAVYVLNHGVGLNYRRNGETRAVERRHDRIARFRIDVTQELREEFTLDEDFQPGVERRWRLPAWPDRMLRSARIWARQVRGKRRPG